MKSILKLLVLCISVSASAQDSKQDNSGTLKVEKADQVQIAQPQILYIGVDNLLRLIGVFDPDNPFNVKISQGWINMRENGVFTAHPVEEGDAVVRVFKNGKVVQRITYRTRWLPDPTASLDGRYVSGRISVARIREVKEVRAEMASFFIEAQFEVLSYNYTFRAKDADLKSLRTTGGDFTTEMMQLLRGCKTGDALFIDDIKAMGPDKRERKLPGLAFQII